MCIKNTATRYGFPSKLLHSILMVCVIAMLIIGSLMGFAPDSFKPTIYMVHKSIGLFTFLCAILFAIWSLMNPKPEFPSNMTAVEISLAKLVHSLLYISIMFMPMIGWLMSSAGGRVPTFFNLFTMPALISEDKVLAGFFADLHNAFAWLIFSLIVIHTIGALKHHFINKDEVLKRIM